MKIAVNTRLLLKDRLEGIGWFTYETLKRISQAHPEHEFYFIFDRPYDSSFVFAKNVKPIVAGIPARHPFLWWLWFQVTVPRVVKSIGAELFISPDGYIPLNLKIPVLNVIHDLNFEHFPKNLPLLSRWYHKYYFPRFARKSTRLLTVSKFSKSDIVKTYQMPEGKIDVAYNGANEIYRPLSAAVNTETRRKYTNGKPYFIFVGAFSPRKNITNLLLAFDSFQRKHKTELHMLVVGEKLFRTSTQENAYKQMQYRHHVHFLGRVAPEELVKLYSAAFALTFVPYFEGFGIPLVEAMKCGIPIITSNITSLPEVAGKGGYEVNPFSVESIANGMEKMYFDTNVRKYITEHAVDRGKMFNWDRTAQEFWISIKNTIKLG